MYQIDQNTKNNCPEISMGLETGLGFTLVNLPEYGEGIPDDHDINKKQKDDVGTFSKWPNSFYTKILDNLFSTWRTPLLPSWSSRSNLFSRLRTPLLSIWSSGRNLFSRLQTPLLSSWSSGRNLFSRLRTPIPSLGSRRSSILLYLMVPAVAFKDSNQGEANPADSGIASFLSPHQHQVQGQPAPPDVEADSPPGKNSADAEAHSPPEGKSGELVATAAGDNTESIPQNVRQFVDRPSSPGYPPLGIRIGRKTDIQNMVNNLQIVPNDAGVFLYGYAPRYGINEKTTYELGIDYIHVSAFIPNKVFMCRDVSMDHKFVTKWVPLVKSEQSRGYELQYKQQITLNLEHQDVCMGLAKVHGVVLRLKEGRKYAEIFLEYCPGGTFSDRLQELRVQSSTVKRGIFRKLLEHVEYLHDHEIIHGDIKLSNLTFKGKSLFDVAIIDFESAKHPQYRINQRSTYSYLPPWFKDCFKGSDFSLLKTLDMWAVGKVLLTIGFNIELWGREIGETYYCNTCNNTYGKCEHAREKFVKMMKDNYPAGMNGYLPRIHPSDNPDTRRLACLIYGLLPTQGARAQLTARDALDTLDESMVVVVVKKNGNSVIPPLIVKEGTSIKMLMAMAEIQNLIQDHSDLQDGIWFTQEKTVLENDVNVKKEFNVLGNQSLTQCCVLHVYPSI